ncbi:MAG: hypothetical protein HOP11_14355 [Saprospiraceae bacterium]|nr:hypothetical protein [Saprospiraceae bacterium]
MATYTKTIQTKLKSITHVSGNAVEISSVGDVSGKLGGLIMVRFGRRSATSGNAGVNIRIEVSSMSSGDNGWFPVIVYTTAFAACESEAVSGTASAGATTISVASTTNLVAGDVIFFANGTAANSEWARIKSIVTNTSITIEDPLTNAQTSSTIYDAAEIYPPISIPEGATRVRVVFDGAGFTQNYAVEASLITIDGIA